MSKHYQMCTRCVMDTTTSEIIFNDKGICNYCIEYLNKTQHIFNEKPEDRKQKLDDFIDKIKQTGLGNNYDCIVGVSGGMDSSWALVKIVELGLKPLAVHMDNGWNSELAQNNIFNLVRGLNVDLYTHVIDWDEYKKLMQSFFKANVIDVEILYDNAMLSVNYRQAIKNKIKYILTGSNNITEGIRIPSDWNWYKYDKKNIKVIGKKFENVKLNTFPSISTPRYFWYEYVRRIRWVSFLDYLNYHKLEALEVLQNDYGFKPYPYKHYESIFTRFYQGYILPVKFNADKRKPHLSALIMSGQMSRKEALERLKGIAYTSEKDLEWDKRYFLKKMDWSESDLDKYLQRDEVLHSAYPSEKALWETIYKCSKFIPKSVKSALKQI